MRLLLRFALVVLAFTATAAATPTISEAHQHGCHRWHTCPSDTGSYVCGDIPGYPCAYGGTPTLPADSDSDGVPDTADSCPTQSGPQPTGCPPPPDSDQDGVLDAQDLCPFEYASGTTAGGCPDSDEDGTADASDDCVDQASSAADGCPVLARSRCTRPSGVQNITFSRTKYPHIRSHFLAALRRGWPRTLVLNRPNADARRDRLLRGFSTRGGYDRDEYPPAVGRGRGAGLTRGSAPRGWRADVRLVPNSENRSHGATLGTKLRRFCNGTRFRYVFY